jgi:hypothetical protein
MSSLPENGPKQWFLLFEANKNTPTITACLLIFKACFILYDIALSLLGLFNEKIQ